MKFLMTSNLVSVPNIQPIPIMVIAQLVDKVTDGVEKNETTIIGIFLDLSKAFDAIYHKILFI